jgi:nucleoside phosphorylase
VPVTLVVLTALDLEYAAVCAHLRRLTTHRHPAGTIFEVGRVVGSDIRVAVAVVGPGTATAAIIAERAIDEFHPEALFVVGVAGGLKRAIKLGDVVVATKVYGYHGGAVDGTGFSARPDAWDAPHDLEQLARQVARTGSWATLIGRRRLVDAPFVHFKPIAAGDVLLNSRSAVLVRQLQRNYNDAVAIEMESAGVCKAGQLRRVPTLTVRSVSDHADGRKGDTDGAGWQTIAASHAAAFTIALIAAMRQAPVETA